MSKTLSRKIVMLLRRQTQTNLSRQWHVYITAVVSTSKSCNLAQRLQHFLFFHAILRIVVERQLNLKYSIIFSQRKP